MSQLSGLRHLDLGLNLLHTVPPSLSLVPIPGLASLNMDGGDVYSDRENIQQNL